MPSRVAWRLQVATGGQALQPLQVGPTQPQPQPARSLATHPVPALAADYRVPVVLRELGVLCYAPKLAAAVDAKRELAPGSQEEVEIRAVTVVSEQQRWCGWTGISG